MARINLFSDEGFSTLWQQILLQFIRKEEGKGLSTHDLTDELLKKIQTAGTSFFDGNYNSLINQPQINGITLAGNKTLEDLGITKAIKDEFGNVTQISFETVDSFENLPVIGEVGVFYLVPNSGIQNNNYDEYIWNAKNFKYELIGAIQTEIDLSQYIKKTNVVKSLDEITEETPSESVLGVGIGREVMQDREYFQNRLDSMISNANDTPVGTVISFMGNSPPKDYLNCDGAEYSITEYRELADFFQDQFGITNFFGGDGITTFAVPNLQGEFLRGTGTNGHVDSGNGADVGEHQDGTLIPYIQIYSDGKILAERGRLNENVPIYYDVGLYDKRKVSTVGPSISTMDYNYLYRYSVRPTNTSVLYCIKYRPTFHTQTNMVNYSYEEQRIGTWVDGKPLYEKTMDFGTIPANANKLVPHNINDADEIFVVNAYTRNDSGSSEYLLPYLYQNKNEGITIGVNKSSIVIVATGTYTSYTKTMVVLRYTKTTD